MTYFIFFGTYTKGADFKVQKNLCTRWQHQMWQFSVSEAAFQSFALHFSKKIRADYFVQVSIAFQF